MRSVERFCATLHERGADIAIVDLQQSTRTAEMAAGVLGCAVGAIVKSLVFETDGQLTLVLASGDRRVDTAKVGALVGASQVTMARGATVKDATGYAIGGVPPLLSDPSGQQVPTLMDESLFRFATVYAAAGSPFSIFPVGPDVLLRMTGARRADLVEAEAEPS